MTTTIQVENAWAMDAVLEVNVRTTLQMYFNGHDLVWITAKYEYDADRGSEYCPVLPLQPLSGKTLKDIEDLADHYRRNNMDDFVKALDHFRYIVDAEWEKIRLERCVPWIDMALVSKD